MNPSPRPHAAGPWVDGVPPRRSLPLATGPRVLHLEDNPDDALLCAELLRAVRPSAVIVRRSRLAEVSPELTQGVDCALLDLTLPDATGLEGLHRLRDLSPYLPIIVLTGLDDVETGLAALRTGAQDYLVKNQADGLALDRAIRYAVERMRLERALLEQAMYDPLTGLGNRALFQDRLEAAYQRSRRQPAPLALVLLDIDDFKSVNDSLGHQVGDELLVQIAHRIRGTLRPSDTLCRLSGDEFVVAFEEVESPEQVVGLAERLSAAFDTPFEVSSGQLVVGASIGVALAEPGWKPDWLLRDVDTAMYAAKRRGRHRIEWFRSSLREEVLQRFARERALREAVGTGDGLRVAYQSVVDLTTGATVGLEALARWDHPLEGPVPPDEFIPLAISTGLISRLDWWVIEHALHELSRRRRETPELVLSVNVAGPTLRSEDFEGRVMATVRELGLPARAVAFEIPETTMLAPGSAETLRRLRGRGFRVALDDFGAGASSLSHFLSLSADVIKLDRSFVRAAAQGNRRATALLRLITSAGTAAGMTVVAEGIEGRAELDVCRSLGVAWGQGYLWGRP